MGDFFGSLGQTMPNKNTAAREAAKVAVFFVVPWAIGPSWALTNGANNGDTWRVDQVQVTMDRAETLRRLFSTFSSRLK